MMPKNIIKMMTTTKSTTTTILTLSKPPSVICGGFIDTHGIWNNGFACPVQNLIQYLCCGTDSDHHCCSPDHYLSEITSSNEPIYISGQYQPSNHIVIDHSPHTRNSLISNSNIINKQFEQFQKYFLPIFLLTSSILFLVGIAIWFWLYKHKAFYAMDHQDSNQQNTVETGKRRMSQSIRNDSLINKRESRNLSMEEKSRRLSHPITEV